MPRGRVEDCLDTLAEHARQLVADNGRRMSLIGWNLGGIYAREVAKILKGRVRRVITIGTPFSGSAARRVQTATTSETQG